jgi:hypothetical protein
MGENAHRSGRLIRIACFQHVTSGTPAPTQAVHRPSMEFWMNAILKVLTTTDIVFALGALLLIRLSARLGMWPYALVALPGTLAHELAHFLVALLLFANPSFPSLVPQRTPHGWRLGSVAFRAGLLRSVPIALAPLLLAPIAVFWIVTFMPAAPWPWYGLHAWIAGALLSACLPSSADLKIAIPALVLVAVVAGFAWYLMR